MLGCKKYPYTIYHMFHNMGRLINDGWKFIVVGGINTLLGVALYQFFLFFVSEKIAWTISWLIGIVLITFAYPKLVFKEGKLSPYRFIIHVVYYLCSFLLSLGLLILYVDILGVGSRVAVFLVLFVTVPLNFACSRFIFTFK